MRKVKIVCTMGPSTAGTEKLEELIYAGMDVARLNFSHGDHASHQKMYNDLREAAHKAGKPLAIVADLCGPKIRVHHMAGGAITLAKGALITLTNEEVLGTPDRISHSYATLAQDTKPGHRILLDDGMLELKVEKKAGNDVICRVVNGGVLKDHKGMNLPGAGLSVPALTTKDKDDIEFGKKLGVDFFALSFVRTAKDLEQAKVLAGTIPVIAKIEKPEAIENLETIINASDGTMVARGDLGVEVGPEKVPLLQKRIIERSREIARPVITATQMLESMIHNPRPTRAEVSDVANAVLDGTDAVMLSAETSVGAYAVEAVKTLDSIIREIEGSDYYSNAHATPSVVLGSHFSHAVANAATEVARHLNLAAIAVYTESGRSAALVSAYRPAAAIIAFSRHAEILNRMSLHWGIQPLHGEWVRGVQSVVEQAETSLLKNNLVKAGDDIVITFGMVLDQEPFQTNMLKLWKVRGKTSR